MCPPLWVWLDSTLLILTWRAFSFHWMWACSWAGVVCDEPFPIFAHRVVATIQFTPWNLVETLISNTLTCLYNHKIRRESINYCPPVSREVSWGRRPMLFSSAASPVLHQQMLTQTDLVCFVDEPCQRNWFWSFTLGHEWTLNFTTAWA